MVAINPAKRLAQARDAQRKSDVNAIANALVAYFAIRGTYPTERDCDSSIGTNSIGCPEDPPKQSWITGCTDGINAELVCKVELLKKLPIDPKNNQNYYYKYEPFRQGGGTSLCSTGGSNACYYYWIGALLESPDDPTKAIFRCSDNVLLAEGAGCKEVTGIDMDGEYAP